MRQGSRNTVVLNYFGIPAVFTSYGDYMLMYFQHPDIRPGVRVLW